MPSREEVSSESVPPSVQGLSEDEPVRSWIKQRVAADEPLRRAAAARTLEPPPVEYPREGHDTDDVVDLLGRDHNQVKYLQEQLEAIPGVTKGGTANQQERRAAILELIRARLLPHERAEDECFWPAVREAVPGGDDLADRASEQEQQGKQLLEALEGVSGTEKRFDELVEELSAALRKHVAFEDSVFLLARDALPPERLAEIGREVMAMKRKGAE
jgi:hypothetical protein